MANTVPIRILKTRLDRQCNILEIGKVRLEAIEYGARKALSGFHLNSGPLYL